MKEQGFNDHSARRRRGQTLAEFALTLPILLMLTFGIIEFGRLFQSWVTLQNAAREAARYTTTGQFDENKYSMDMLPCRNEDSSGERFNYYPDPDDPDYIIEVYGVRNPDGTYDITPKSLFTTWYDGEVCDPGKPEHDENRKDILRLASIMDVARRGAAGLSLEPNPRAGDFDSLETMLFSVWQDPLPRSDLPRWFDVSVCSSRTMMRTASVSHDPQASNNQRFVTVYDSDSAPASASREYGAPYCMLNEAHPDSLTNLDERPPRNQGTRWLDPGGPGDRITVFVVYNHPLITPLGLAEFVRMEARRSGVNESFRASRALNAVQGSPAGANLQATPTARPPTSTPTDLPTWTPTPTATHTPTPTPTSTLGPFTCDQLFVTDLSFDRERVYFHVYNHNVQDTLLHRVHLNWQPSTVYPDMYLRTMAMNNGVLWRGEQTNPPIDTNNLTGEDLDRFNGADRQIPGNGTRTRFEAVFLNAGNNLGSHLRLQDFGGSIFEFYDTINNELCAITVQVPDDEDDPQDPNFPTPPPPTPLVFDEDCASEFMTITVDRFESFGVVRLRVESMRPQPSPLLGFYVDWSEAKAIRSWLTLDRISMGGSSAFDTDYGVEVWSGPSNGPITSASGAGLARNFTFPPFSTTFVYLDFGGTTTDLASLGIRNHMFNNTFFDILCIDPGTGNGGSGQPPTGQISPFHPSPTPPPTPVPQDPPTPTPVPGSIEIRKTINWDGNTPLSPAPEFWVCVRRSGVYDQCHKVSAAIPQVLIPGLWPGEYQISENPNPADRWSVTINGQQRTWANVQVTSDNTTTVNVNNRYIPPPPPTPTPVPGSLTVTKVINWDGNVPLSPAPGFTICVTGPNSYNQCVTLTGGQSHTFTGLPPGNYNVNENNPGPDWVVTGQGSVSVQSSQGSSATITNRYAPDDEPPDGYDPGDGEDASQG